MDDSFWSSGAAAIFSLIAAITAYLNRRATNNLNGGLQQSLDEAMLGATTIKDNFVDAVMQELAAVICDLETGSIIWLTEPCERMFGYLTGELIHQSVDDLVPFEAREAHVRHRMNYRDHPTARRMGAGLILAGKKKNGRLFPVEISLSARVITGRHVVIAIIHDMTARRVDMAGDSWKPGELPAITDSKKDIKI